MKYTYKDLMEHIEEEERDFTIIKIDGNVISVSRDCSFGGSSCGRYFSARLNGKIVCTRCARDIGIRKALAVLNNWNNAERGGKSPQKEERMSDFELLKNLQSELVNNLENMFLT